MCDKRILPSKNNKRFIDALYPFQPEVKAVPLNRKHVPMVTQYFYP
jgi:hypothetical protein